MDINTIRAPIRTELKEVRKEILALSRNFLEEEEGIASILSEFFSAPGKLLRPSLLILTAFSLLPADLKDVEREKTRGLIIKLAAVIELVHNASLIHDDILDDSQVRRMEAALNKKYNNKVALLLGDLIYTESLFALVSSFSPVIINEIILCIKEMTLGETKYLLYPLKTEEDYYGLVLRKTASLMSVSCRIGAFLSTDDESRISEMTLFGKNFGLAYQLIDDFKDKDLPAQFIINNREKAVGYIEQAKNNLDNIPQGKYKDSLDSLCSYIIL